MITRVQIIKEVCQELEIPFESIDQDEIIFRLEIHGKPRFILNSTMGFIPDVEARLTKDKAYQYQILAQTKLMPHTKSYLDPACKFATESTIPRETIARDIIQTFSLPIIMKKNSGTEGVHVFKVTTESQIAKAIKIIFNQRDKDYDHVLIVQPFIEPQTEYRVIILDGHIEFAYTKSFITGQSSLKSVDRWQASKAHLVTKQNTLQKLQSLVSTLNATWPIRYAGLDVIQDTNGKFWLIELNSSPMFAYFLRDNGPELIKKLFTKIFQKLLEEYYT